MENVSEHIIQHDDGHRYRLDHIEKMQTTLETERIKRLTLSSRYRHWVTTLSVTSEVMLVITMGLGTAGIGVMSSVVAAPVAIGMEVATLIIGAGILIGSRLGKRFTNKVKKHAQIHALVEYTLIHISDMVSRALNDENISDEEYSSLMKEFDTYMDKKEKIRNGSDASDNDSTLDTTRAKLLEKFKLK